MSNKTHVTIQDHMASAERHIKKITGELATEKTVFYHMNASNQRIGSAVALMVAELADERYYAWSKEFGKLYFRFSEIRSNNPFVDIASIEPLKELYSIVNTMYVEYF